MKRNQQSVNQFLAQILCIFFSMLTILSCNRQAAEKPNIEKFTLFAEAQSVNQVDVAHEGSSHGDLFIFEGLLTDKDNNAVGHYTGMHKTMSLPHKMVILIRFMKTGSPHTFTNLMMVVRLLEVVFPITQLGKLRWI